MEDHEKMLATLASYHTADVQREMLAALPPNPDGEWLDQLEHVQIPLMRAAIEATKASLMLLELYVAKHRGNVQ